MRYYTTIEHIMSHISFASRNRGNYNMRHMRCFEDNKMHYCIASHSHLWCVTKQSISSKNLRQSKANVHNDILKNNTISFTKYNVTN